jgi:hypothetical protein
VTIAKRPSWRGGMICFYSCFYLAVKLISEIQKLTGAPSESTIA